MAIDIDAFLDEVVPQKEQKKIVDTQIEPEKKPEQPAQADAKPEITLTPPNISKPAPQPPNTKPNSQNNLQLPNVPDKLPLFEEKKYTLENLKTLKSNVETIENSIKRKLKALDDMIKKQKHWEIPHQLEQVQQEVNKIPQNFEIYLLETKFEARRKELEIYQMIEQFKTSQQQNINQQLKKELQTLVNNLTPGNSSFVYSQFKKIEQFWESIPPLFRESLSDEKLLVSKGELKAHEYLLNEKKKLGEQKVDSVKTSENQAIQALKSNNKNLAKQWYVKVFNEITKNHVCPLDKEVELLEIATQIQNYLNDNSQPRLSHNNNVSTNSNPRQSQQNTTQASQFPQQNNNVQQRPTTNSNLDNLCNQFYNTPDKKEAKKIYRDISQELKNSSMPASEVTNLKKKLVENWRDKK